MTTFGRVCEVDIDGTLHAVGLRVEFHIERSHVRGSNKGTVAIYNLSKTTRAKLAQSKAIRIVAGYEDQAGVIYQGRIVRLVNERLNEDYVTTFQLADAAYSLGDFRIRKTYTKGTAYVDMVRDLGASMNVNTANARAQLQVLDKRTATRTIDKAVSLSGTSDAELDKLMKTLGLDYSIQNDELIVTRPGRARNDSTAILLNSETGLIGSPDISEKGKVRVEVALSHRLAPAELVKVESEQLKQFYRIDRVCFSGDTHGDTWRAILDLRSL